MKIKKKKKPKSRINTNKPKLYAKETYIYFFKILQVYSKSILFGLSFEYWNFDV